MSNDMHSDRQEHGRPALERGRKRALERELQASPLRLSVGWRADGRHVVTSERGTAAADDERVIDGLVRGGRYTLEQVVWTFTQRLAAGDDPVDGGDGRVVVLRKTSGDGPDLGLWTPDGGGGRRELMVFANRGDAAPYGRALVGGRISTYAPALVHWSAARRHMDEHDIVDVAVLGARTAGAVGVGGPAEPGRPVVFSAPVDVFEADGESVLVRVCTVLTFGERACLAVARGNGGGTAAAGGESCDA